MSFQRRAYDMDLGRRDHTRWLGSNRYAGGSPAPSLPIDWSTDLLFARASAATYWDGTTLTRYTSGTARVLGDGSLYVEGARTNKIHNSSTYTSLTAATAVNDSGTNPAGDVTSADQITCTGATGCANFDSGTVLAAGAISATSFVRWVANTVPMVLALKSAAGTGSTPATFSPTGSWARYVNNFASSAGGTLQVRTQENASGNDNVFLAWGVQAEEGGFASQLIETSGSAATRLADDAVIEDADVPAAMRSGAFKVTIKPRRASTQANDTSTGTLFAFGSGTDNRIYINASNQIVVRESGVDVVTTGALTWTADLAITLTFDAAAGSVIVSGATTGNGTTTGTAWTMPSGDVHVGNDAALGTAFFGSISPPVVP